MMNLTQERYQILRERIHVVSMWHLTNENNPKEFIKSLKHICSCSLGCPPAPTFDSVVFTLTAEDLVRWNERLLEAVND